MNIISKLAQSNISRNSLIASILFAILLLLATCQEYPDIGAPLLFNYYYYGNNKIEVERSFSLWNYLKRKPCIDYYAVIEEKIFSNGKKLRISKVWFQKSGKARMEEIVPGQIPRVVISRGSLSWNFSLIGPHEAYERKARYLADFMVYKLTSKDFNIFEKNKIISKIGNEFLYEEKDSIKNNMMISRVWIDNKSLLPTRWEQIYYDQKGEVIRDRKCNKIIYDIPMSEKLFRLPEGLKIEKERIQLYYSNGVIPSTLSQEKLQLTQEDVNNWLNIEKDLKRIIEIDPNNYDCLNDLGYIALLKNDSIKAEELFLKAIGLNTKNEKAYYNLIGLYIKQNMIEKCRALIDKYEKACPPENPEDYFMLGNLYENAGFVEEAISRYKLANELQKDDIYIDKKGGIYKIEGLKNAYLKTYQNALRKLKK